MKRVHINERSYLVPDMVWVEIERLRIAATSTQVEEQKREGEALGAFRQALVEPLRLANVQQVLPYLTHLGVLQSATLQRFTRKKDENGDHEPLLNWKDEPVYRTVYFASEGWERYLFNRENVNLTDGAVGPKYNTVRIHPGMQEEFLRAVVDEHRFHHCEGCDVLFKVKSQGEFE